MRIFVTGATGHIGSIVVQELMDAGHKVIGLSRSDNGAKALKKAGAEVHRGSLDDLDSLRRGAAIADGVIHLAFRNDFSDFAGSLATDLRAIETIGKVLESSGKPFIITNHMNGDASVNAVFALTGVRSSVVSLSPTVHGEEDKHGFVPTLINIAHKSGISAFVGDGSNRWPAVHELDAAKLYRLALEKASAGSMLIGRAEEGVPFRDIASAIGKHLNLPVVSILLEEADSHFGFFGAIAAVDIPSIAPGSSVQTKEILGWRPVHPGLIADIEQGHYFKK